MGDTVLGFISPGGEFYECDRYNHMNTANRILGNEYGIECNTPVDTLSSLGWVVIQSGFVGFVGNDIDSIPSLTNEQKDFLLLNLHEFNSLQRLSCEMCIDISEL